MLLNLVCAALVRQAGGRISIMPGGGVTEENVETIMSVTGKLAISC